MSFSCHFLKEFPMRQSRIYVALLVVLTLVCQAAPARAEVKPNFVTDFLRRYRPTSGPTSGAGSQVPQEIGNLIRSGQLPLTMGDLINLILQNNLDISVNRLSPLSSQYLIDSLYRQFEPTLHLQATVNRNTTPSTSVLAGNNNPSTLGGAYTVGFSQNLLTGTLIGIDAAMNRNSSNSSFSTLNPTWQGSLRYSFTQHLLRDFGRRTNSRQILAARNSEKISEIQFERQLLDLVAQAQRAYWDLVFAAEDIKVKQRSVDLAQKTLSDNKIQVDIGTLAPIDLVQAESEVANRNVQFVTSTYTEVQTQDLVKKLLTSQGDPGTLLAKLTPMEGVRKPSDSDVLPVDQAIKIALENRPEMKQFQLDLENKNIDLEYTKNQLLPTIDFIASYTQTGVAGTPLCSPTLPPNTKCTPAPPNSFFRSSDPINPDLIGGLGTSFGQLFSYNYSGYSAGISVQIPLRNRAAQADNARAANEKRIAENRITAQAQQIALEVRNALTQVDMNKARIEAAQKARELAERRLDAEQKKFDLGASTIRFVLEEQRNVAQAQTDEIQSLINYTKSVVDFDRATGMTLKKNNIEIEKTLSSGATAK
jgi:outer membrane protein